MSSTLRCHPTGARWVRTVEQWEGTDVNRHQFLGKLHECVRPRSYLEIGVNDGRSLALSRAASIAIDPAFRVTTGIHCDVELVKATSDDFFARESPVDHLPGSKIDLAFIDGMHLFEFALRDFRNVERYASWTSVIVLDDMLPRSVAEAARDRHTIDWTGDVFKLAPVLRRYRPDLVCLTLDTKPTGLLLVLGADSGNTSLFEHYDDILAEFITPDPQEVPEEILQRTGSADPDLVLASDVWPRLVRAREQAAPRNSDLLDSLRPLAGTGPTSPVVAPTPVPLPPPKPPRPAAPATTESARKPSPKPAASRRPARRVLRRVKRVVRKALRHR